MRRHSIIRALALLALTASAARAQKKILVYTRNFTPDNKGYVHENIPFAVAALTKIGAEQGLTVHVTDDPSVFDDAKLAQYAALVFANSNNEAFATDAQKDAFRRYIQRGGGFVGIHSASGSQRDWPYFWSVVGGKFVVHPKIQPFTVRVVDSAQVATAGVPAEFEWTDEFYFLDHLNSGIHPVLVSDRTKLRSTEEMKPPASEFPNPTPLAWWQTFDGGREFYIALGHDKATYTNPILTRLIANAIVWATTKPKHVASSDVSVATVPKPTRSGYAAVNGLQMYYEMYGSPSSRMPLVLLHGGGSTIGTNFSRIIPLLESTRTVIAVEFQAHGHTRDVDRPFTFEQDADDIFALLHELHIPKADLLGFSNGGTTAMQVAIRHPEVVNRLVIASANYRRDGMQSGFWDFMKNGTFADMPQPYKDAYLKIVPSEEGLHAMYERDNRRMLAFKDIPDEAIRSIHAPALVVVGDADVIQPEHALALSRLLPHGRLCILPGTHGSYMGEIMTPLANDEVPRTFVSIVTQYLSSKVN